MVRDEQIYNSIKKELDDHLNVFNNNIGEDLKNIRNHTYVSRVLLTDVYKSLVNSGKFLTLVTQLQNEISNLYSRINRRNDILNHLHRHEDAFFMNKPIIYESDRVTWEYKIEKYAAELSRLESEIKNLMQKIYRIID